MNAGTTSQVLVLVKASPQPSATYGDTVCVAGIDLQATLPRWVRLYPVPFRYLDGESQFEKYEIIQVRTRDAGADKRPESRKIDATSIVRLGAVRGWSARSERIRGLAEPTMCELVRGTQQNLNAQSLGAVRVRHVKGLGFEPHPGWTPEQQRRLDTYRAQGDLFSDATPTTLEAPRLVVRLSYQCLDSDCPGHQQRIIDWELTALQGRYRGRDESALQSAVTKNFWTIPFAPERDTLVFVGNQENVQRRSSFTILGLYYPRLSEVEQSERLF